MRKMENKTLSELKDQYSILKKNYELPDFTELNKLFDIEDVEPKGEFLLKKIRKFILEKIGDYLRFFDIILNPNNTPMFFFKLLNKLDKEDKEIIASIYEKLGSFEILSVSLDIDYLESKEADFIKNIFLFFKEDMKVITKIIDKLNNSESRSMKINGSYFG